MECNFCKAKATGNSTPPACPVHEDLLFITEYMAEKDIKVTVESVTKQVAIFRTKSGGWTILPEQVGELLPEFLKAREKAAAAVEG